MTPRAVVRHRLVAVALGGLLVAGCTGTGPSADGPVTTGATPPMPATASSSPATASSASASPRTSTAPVAPAESESPEAASVPSAAGSVAADGTWAERATGLSGPVATLVDPRTGDLLVAELPGTIRALDGTVVLDLSDRVTTGGERGLLDATPTPDGTHLVVHYSGVDGATTLSLFAIPDDPADGLADPADEQVLLELDQPASNHNGGSVVFGPDGMLYLALGDGGRGNDAFGHGGDPNHPLGAILRLDVTTRLGAAVVPDDNPFVDGDEGDARVWAHGLRNPWRIATDGERWYVADVGQDDVEELTVVPADTGPHDLGWPDWEGDRCRVEDCETMSLQPAVTWAHEAGACSIIGGAIDADGRFWFTDLCDPRTWSLGPDGSLRRGPDLPGPAVALDADEADGVVGLLRDGRVVVLETG
jgi:glucose/arabinose dehydrogenase